MGSQDEREIYKSELRRYFQSECVYSSLSRKSRERLEKNVLRILDSKEKTDIEIVKDAPNILDFMGEASLKEFENLAKLLEVEEIPFIINQRLVRGIDYYNGICFEFKPFEGEELSQSTVIAGGRYDSLADMILRGNKNIDLKSTGFAMGIERAMLVSRDDLTSDWYSGKRVVIVKIFESEDLGYLTLENKIRKIFDGDNESVSSVKVQGKKIGKKLEELRKLDFTHAIVVGENELDTFEIEVKNIETETVEKIIKLK